VGSGLARSISVVLSFSFSSSSSDGWAGELRDVGESVEELGSAGTFFDFGFGSLVASCAELGLLNLGLAWERVASHVLELPHLRLIRKRTVNT